MMGLSSLREIKKYLPFSYPNIIRNLVDKEGVTILDIGTGDGFLMKHVNQNGNYEITGIEAYKPFMKMAQKSGAYINVIWRDARKIDYPNNSFDIVISSQVLEYLTKKEGIRLIKKCKKIAKRQVIMAAYIGDCGHIDAQGNPFQTSHGAWYPGDLMKLGFKVYGQGLRAVYKENGYNPKKIDFLFVLPMVFSYLLAPFVYCLPQYATHMIAVLNKVKLS